MIIKVRVLSDMHVGSSYGICPRHLMVKKPNAFQDWVIDRWTEMCKKEPTDYLYLLGDIVDGENLKDTSGLCIPDKEEQANAAIELIRPLIGRHTKVLGVSGSRYHCAGIARTITERLNGKHSVSFTSLLLDRFGMEGITFHHKSTNSRTEVTKILIRRGRFPKAPTVGMLVGGHLHRYEYIVQDGVRVIHTPCWEYETPFMDHSMGFDIGSIQLYIDTDKKCISVIEDDRFVVPREVFVGMQSWEGVSPADYAAMEIRKKERELQDAKELVAQSLAIAKLGSKTESSRPGRKHKVK